MTVGSLRAEGTLGGHSVQNPGPSTVGCDVRLGSSWLYRSHVRLLPVVVCRLQEKEGRGAVWAVLGGRCPRRTRSHVIHGSPCSRSTTSHSRAC